MTDTATKGDTKAANGTEAAAEAAGRAPRTSPSAGEVVTEIPSSSRQGFWATEAEWFMANPNVVKKYTGISPTTASYLRSEYGLEAHSRNTQDKRCDLYVKYDPNTAEALKNRPKRPRKAKAESKATASK
jgi:hypothetical protein